MKVLYNDGHVDECPADEVTARRPPQRRPHHGPGHQAPLPRGRLRLRPRHRQRLLLRHRPARGPEDHRRGLPRHRGRDEEDREGEPQVLRLRASARRGHRAHGGARREVQGRAHRRPARGRAHHLLPAGRVHRHVRGPAPHLHQGAQGLQAHGRLGRLLEGRQGQQDAHPRQRHGVCHQRRARRAPAPARGGQEARPPQDRPRDGPLHDARRGARLPVLPAQRHDSQERAPQLLARDPPRGRLRRDLHAA